MKTTHLFQYFLVALLEPTGRHDNIEPEVLAVLRFGRGGLRAREPWINAALIPESLPEELAYALNIAVEIPVVSHDVGILEPTRQVLTSLH